MGDKMDFRKIFQPTKEERIKTYEHLLELQKKYHGRCCSCKNYEGSNERGFVTDYGKCKVNCGLFTKKVIAKENIDCKSYVEDVENVKMIKESIKKLKGEKNEDKNKSKERD